jgi:hypothetical protein
VIEVVDEFGGVAMADLHLHDEFSNDEASQQKNKDVVCPFRAIFRLSLEINAQTLTCFLSFAAI